MLLVVCCVIYLDAAARYKRTNTLYWVSVTPFFLIWGVALGYRHKVGADYDNYKNIFDDLSKNDGHNYYERFEPAFVYLNEFLGHLGFSSNFFLFFCYIISFTLLLASISNVSFKSAKMTALSLILLLGFGPLLTMTNTVRQDFVISLSIFIFTLLYRRRLLSSFLTSTIGVFFHYSAPITVLYAIVPRSIISPWIWLVLTVLTFLLSGSLLNYAFDALSNGVITSLSFAQYIQGAENIKPVAGIGLRLWFDILLFLVLSSFVKKIDEKGIVFFNITFFGLLLLYALKEYSVFARVASYFYMFLYLSVPWFLSVFRNVWLKNMFFCLMIIYSSLVFFRNSFSDQYYPYEFWFLQ
jgi:hypothetical protein